MRVSGGFREFVLDQLSGVPGLRARAMFGGVGIYADEVFFGILASDVLYFKVSDTNRHDYEAAGCKPFRPYADRAMTMAYYAVPVEVLEAAPTLVEWAERAVAVARASKWKKTSKKTSRKARKAPRRKSPRG
jgi:DNA transformation protein